MPKIYLTRYQAKRWLQPAGKHAPPLRWREGFAVKVSRNWLVLVIFGAEIEREVA